MQMASWSAGRGDRQPVGSGAEYDGDITICCALLRRFHFPTLVRTAHMWYISPMDPILECIEKEGHCCGKDQIDRVDEYRVYRAVYLHYAGFFTDQASTFQV